MNNPKTKETKRRYSVCKVKKARNKRKMESDEVDSDHKLRQFLADVEKFSLRSKARNEEKQVKNPKNAPHEEKRGLFENGLKSKPSIKGLFGLKNRARLEGNLENLVEDCRTKAQFEDTEPVIHSPDILDSSNNIPNDNSESLNCWWEKNMKEAPQEKIEVNVPQPKCLAEEKKGGENSLQSQVLNELDNLIQFTDDRKKEYLAEVKKALPDFPRSSKEELLLRCQANLISEIQKKFVKKSFEDENGLFNQLKQICEEYILSKKPAMADKSEQTNPSYFSEAMEWDPTAVNSVKQDVACPQKANDFFGNVGQTSRKEEGSFNFIPKVRSQTVEFFTPSKEINFTLPQEPVETPKGFKAPHFSPVVERAPAKPYIPLILSPPSPGRKYRMNLDDDVFNQLLQKEEYKRHARGKTEKKMFRDLPSMDWASMKKRPLLDLPSPQGISYHHKYSSLSLESLSPDFSPPHGSFGLINQTTRNISDRPSNLFNFPKRSKLSFSPHRL